MRKVLLSLVLIGVAAVAAAQQPVPLGGGAAVAVEVVSATGEAMPGVTIEAVAESGQRSIVVTGIDGRAVLPLPAAGRYRVRAMADGFRVIERTIDVGTGQSVSFRLQMGPVPLGGNGGSSPAPAVDRCRIVEATFADDLALQQWLTGRGAEKCLLTTIVQTAPRKAYYVFRSAAAAPRYSVFAMTQPLNAANLNARATANGGLTLRGVHRVSSSLSLLVFSHD